MKRLDAFELYRDYLIAEDHQATATGLSASTGNLMKHDYISDMLADPNLDCKTFWKFVKPFARKIETDDSVISIDDTISEKPHSSINTIVNYHFDHTKGKSIKGINILNFLLSTTLEDKTTVNCPVGFEVIVKDQEFIDKEGKFVLLYSFSKILQRRFGFSKSFPSFFCIKFFWIIVYCFCNIVCIAYC